MSLYRRKNSPYWWIDVVDVRGGRVQQSTGTANRIRAQEFHDRVRVRMWDQKRLGVRPSYTWDEAVVRWLNEKAEKATLRDDKAHLRWLDQHLRGKTLETIDRNLIGEITRARKQPYSIARKKGPARQICPTPATVNRTLEIVRAILRRARDDSGMAGPVPAT